VNCAGTAVAVKLAFTGFLVPVIFTGGGGKDDGEFVAVPVDVNTFVENDEELSREVERGDPGPPTPPAPPLPVGMLACEPVDVNPLVGTEDELNNDVKGGLLGPVTLTPPPLRLLVIKGVGPWELENVGAGP